MFPLGLLTVITPFATVHEAGDLSFVRTHWSRLDPPNSTIASAGGAANHGPGGTLFGTGSHTSVSAAFPAAGCAAAAAFSCWAEAAKPDAVGAGRPARPGIQG